MVLDLVRGVGIEGADVDLRGVHAREDEGGDEGLVLSGVVEVVLDVERVAGDVVEGLDGDGERVVVARDGSTVRETSQKRPSVGASWRQRSGNLTSCSIFGYNSTINALSASSFVFLYMICHFNAAALKNSTMRTSSDPRRNTPPHIFCNTRSNISYRHEKKRTCRTQLLKTKITKLEAEQSADSPSSSSLSPQSDCPSSPVCTSFRPAPPPPTPTARPVHALPSRARLLNAFPRARLPVQDAPIPNR